MKALVATMLLLGATAAGARDIGQWEGADPSVRQWYRDLMQPDNPVMPCCGEADAYHADSFHTDKETGQHVAIVTDERDDAPLGRPHVKPGTRILVPNSKIKWDQGNPTGHGILFLSTSGNVYCFVPPGGV